MTGKPNRSGKNASPEEQCSHRGCTNFRVKSKPWCNKHYVKAVQEGRAIPRRPMVRETLQEKLDRVGWTENENGCHIFPVPSAHTAMKKMVYLKAKNRKTMKDQIRLVCGTANCINVEHMAKPSEVASIAFRMRKHGWKVDDNGCWIWENSKTPCNYGKISNDEYTHRVAYEAYKGKIPKNKIVLRTCGNTMCLNPDHLKLGTMKDAMKIRDAKGAKSPRIPDDVVKKIKRDFATKRYNVAEIARDNGVHYQITLNIVSGKTYKSV